VRMYENQTTKFHCILNYSRLSLVGAHLKIACPSLWIQIFSYHFRSCGRNPEETGRMEWDVKLENNEPWKWEQPIILD
jgi:hypothetical protein